MRGIEWKIMYTINETTGEEYYFNLYEKWWHYFLLGFAYFIPHRAYALAYCSTKKMKKWKNRDWIIMFSGVGIIKALQGVFHFEIPLALEDYIFSYIIIGYILVVLVTIILWKASYSKEIEINRKKYIDIKINLFSFNTFRTIIWRTIGIIFCIIIPFELEVYNSDLIVLMICCVVMIAVVMILYGQKVKLVLENGDIIKFWSL